MRRARWHLWRTQLLMQYVCHTQYLMQCAALGGTYGALLHQNPSVLQQVPMTVTTVDCMH